MIDENKLNAAAQAAKAAELSKLLDQIGAEAPGLLPQTKAHMAEDFRARGITDPARISAVLEKHRQVNPHIFAPSSGGGNSAPTKGADLATAPTGQPVGEREFAAPWAEALHTTGEIKAKRQISILPGQSQEAQARAKLEEFYKNAGFKNSNK